MFTADTHRAQRISRLLQAAQGRGLDRGALLRRIEVTEDQIRDPDSRMPGEKTIRLWRLIQNRLDDPDLGLEVGATFSIREAGVVGYATLHSETLLGALNRIVRFAKLLNQRAELALLDLGDRWRLEALHQPLMPGFRQPIDEGIAGLMTCFSEIVGRPVVSPGLYFNYPSPANTTMHRQLLGNALHFEASNAAIELWDRDVKAETIAADAGLTGYLDQLADIRMQELPEIETYSDRLRQIVWPHLSEGLPSMQEIASEMAMSSRSLQRRLREEDTSFAEVVDGLRREKARLLLRDPNLAVYEVGYLLGYSDPSTFHRAFRRWEGTSPSRFRAQQISSPG